MSTQSPAPRTEADAEPAAGLPRGVTRAPAAAVDPGTRYAGAVSLAAALAGILLGASGASTRASSTPAVGQGAARVAGPDR